jgi:putative phosphoesterase
MEGARKRAVTQSLENCDESAFRRTAVLIGVISDTHGLLRSEALAALRGVERILHAGDVGSPEILDRLRDLAPVTAIRGNVDRGVWAAALPETELVEAGGISIYMLHDIAQLDLKPEAAGFRVLIYGHSHQPKMEEKNGVLYFNPGSAGPRRFRLPVSLGKLVIEDGKVRGELAELRVREK